MFGEAASKRSPSPSTIQICVVSTRISILLQWLFPAFWSISQILQILLNYQILMDLKMVLLIKRTNQRLAAEIFWTGHIGSSKCGKDCKKKASQKMQMESLSSTWTLTTYATLPIEDRTEGDRSGLIQISMNGKQACASCGKILSILRFLSMFTLFCQSHQSLSCRARLELCFWSKILRCFELHVWPPSLNLLCLDCESPRLPIPLIWFCHFVIFFFMLELMKFVMHDALKVLDNVIF